MRGGYEESISMEELLLMLEFKSENNRAEYEWKEWNIIKGSK